jgi:serine phosphatase RsbU (regulator of sigma subunit)
MGTTTIISQAFGKLEPAVLEELRQVARRATYPHSTILCRQGEIEHIFYIVVSGRVAVTQRMADGEERLLALRGPNDYFGELGLLDDTPRMATCTTMVETTVLEIDEAVFDVLVEQSPAIAFSITRHILHIMRDRDEQAIADLERKNEMLRQAYSELEAAQERLVEKERLVREIEIAAQLQQTLLPAELPNCDGYQFAAYIQPARQVGGDFYDVFALDDDHYGLLLADVADKSVQAALFMAVAYTLFTVESQRSLSPAAVALAVHRGMFEVAANSDMFVTAFYGVLHRPTGRLTYVLAGQERPLLLRHGRAPETVAGNGRFLGMLEELQLTEFTMQLQAGDRLLIFSDGVPDAVNPAGAQYDYERLTAVLHKNQTDTAAELIRRIVADLHHWTWGTTPFDDITLLAVQMDAVNN